MKKSYVVPNMNIVIGTAHNMLATSANDIKKIFCSETRCPFNNEWCADKQERLEAWQKAVNHAAVNHSSYLFHTAANMFDGCPHSYKVLCAAHEQKQR